MQWQFKTPLEAIVTDEIEMTYTILKWSWKNLFKGIRLSDKQNKRHRLIWHPEGALPQTKDALFSYAHVIYFLEKSKLKEGWNIIVYHKNRALITKGQALFLEVKSFDTLPHLYQYLYRFEFDDSKPFQLIENTKNPLVNIEEALSNRRFKTQFNLTKNTPWVDMMMMVGLVFLFIQTAPTSITSLSGVYPKDQFFKTIVFLEMHLKGRVGIERVESKNKKLYLTFSAKIPSDIKKGLPADVITSHH